MLSVILLSLAQTMQQVWRKYPGSDHAMHYAHLAKRVRHWVYVVQ
jgi:hypothetical protein